MTRFIEKHRRLLQAYFLIASIFGWVLILGGVFWLFAILGNHWQIKEEQRQVVSLLYILSALVYDFVIPGFLAFVIGGLLDFLLRPMKKSPTILGMTNKLCYIYAVFLILQILPVVAVDSGFLFVNVRYLTIPENIGTYPNAVGAPVALDNLGENSASHRHRYNTALSTSPHRRIENDGLNYIVKEKVIS